MRVNAMDIPDVSTLVLNEPGSSARPAPSISDVIMEGEGRYMEKLRNYAESLPYSIEPYSKMLELLDLIILRIAQCVEAKDYDPGLLQWDSMLT